MDSTGSDNTDLYSLDFPDLIEQMTLSRQANETKSSPAVSLCEPVHVDTDPQTDTYARSYQETYSTWKYSGGELRPIERSQSPVHVLSGPRLAFDEHIRRSHVVRDAIRTERDNRDEANQLEEMLSWRRKQLHEAEMAQKTNSFHFRGYRLPPPWSLPVREKASQYSGLLSRYYISEERIVSNLEGRLSAVRSAVVDHQDNEWRLGRLLHELDKLNEWQNERTKDKEEGNDEKVLSRVLDNIMMRLDKAIVTKFGGMDVLEMCNGEVVEILTKLPKALQRAIDRIIVTHLRHEELRERESEFFPERFGESHKSTFGHESDDEGSDHDVPQLMSGVEGVSTDDFDVTKLWNF